MSAPGSSSETDQEQRIVNLVRSLREIEQELQSLTGGQVDAVSGPGGRPIFLQEAQEKLLQSENRYRSLSKATAQIVWTTDANGLVSGELPDWQAFTGQSTEEILGYGCQRAIHPEDQKRTFETWTQAVSSGTSYDLEYRLRRHDGVYRDFAVRGVPVHAGDGSISEWVGCCMDITERRKREGQLHLLETCISRLNDVVLITEADPLNEPGPRIQFVNEAFERLAGYSRGEVIGKTPRLLQGPKTDRAELARMKGALSKGESVRAEIINYSKGGAEYWIEMDIVPILSPSGVATHFVAIERDITERRKREEQLRLLETCVSRLNDVILICSTENFDENEGPQIAYVNPAFEQMTGYTSAEVIGKRPPELLHGPETDPIVVTRIHQALKKGEPVRAELMHYTKAGKKYWNEINVVPIFSSSGVMTHFVSVERDNTKRKQAEETLRQKDTLIRMAGRLTRMGGWFMKLSDRQVAWSDDVCDIMECPHGHVTDLADALALHPEGSRDAVAFAVEACARDGVSFDIETEIHTVRGRRIWGRVCGEPERDADGTIQMVWGAFQDITDQKLASEELGKNQALLRVASRVGQLGAWQVAAPFQSVKWSDETAIIHDETAGFSPDIGDAIKYYCPKYRGVIRRAFKACVEDGTSFDIEAQIDTAKGRRVWVRAIGEAVTDAHGRVIEVRGGLQDITFLKQSEERLIEQAALLDIARDAIMVKDMDDRIIYWNKGAESTYGWTAGEAMGRRSVDLLYGNASNFQEAYAALLLNGEWEGEMLKQSKDGRELTVEVSWTLVRDENDHPKSVLAINTDITEKKKIEAHFMRAQRLESIGTLAGGIAHDLNNILAPILMSIDLLKSESDSPQTTKILQTIQISAKRGADIVRQVLSFARGMEGQRVEVQPKHLVNDLESIIRDIFPKDIRLHFSVPDDTWTILGDPTQVHQVLLNLSVNARDSMPNGGNLSVSAENAVLDNQYAAMHSQVKAGHYVKIKVTDSGTGIPPKLIDKIFEPFFTTKELSKGTGLGLSTVMAIVKSHGGMINVYSDPGKGTSFSVYLPAIEVSAEAEKEQPDGRVSMPRGNGETILVVDDEASILTITGQTLEAYGYRVLTAIDGADAVGTYVQNRDEIAVVLTDMMMPVMDGSAMVHALRRLNPTIKIIAASGLNAEGEVNKAAAGGLKHFLIKPYTAQVLLQTIRTILDET
jgi:PAS domain S-box-containing protein